MSSVASPVRAGTAPAAAVALGGVLLLMVAVASPVPMWFAMPVALAGMVFAAFHRALLSWQTLVGVLIVFILFLPMRRYTLPVNVGNFELEPYRVLVMFLLAGWIAMLLVDPSIRLRPTGLEGPIMAIGLATAASVLVNFGSISSAGVTTDVVKAITFFASFFLVYLLVVNTIRPSQVLGLVQLLVAGGTVVAALAIYEARSGYNLFDHLAQYIPILQEHALPDRAADLNGFQRGDRLRVYGSAEHPIALAAALAMLLPLAIGLAASRSRWWWVSAAVISAAALSTLSRTGVIMLVAIGLVFVWMRPRQTLRYWWTVIPALVVVHVALPHTLGIIKSSFFPQGGLVQDQQSSAGSKTAGGRLTDIGPVLARVASQPALGVGFGSQVWRPGEPQAVRPDFAQDDSTRILDNQWLGTLLETGVLGVLAWIWLFRRFLVRVRRRASQDDSADAWLAVAVVAGVAAQMVAMFTYDALAFVQATFILFLLLAFGTLLSDSRSTP